MPEGQFPRDIFNQKKERLAVSDGIDHQLDILWVCVWCDAVAKVKDVWAFRERLDRATGLGYECIAACDHMRGFEVPLHTATCLQVCRCPFSGDTIINCDTISARGRMRANILLTRAAREGDDGYARVFVLERGGDFGHWLDRIVHEIIALQ